MSKFLKDEQIDLTPILKKVVAIIGYGAQGRSHALNLKDSGINVVVGQRSGKGFQKAVDDGFEPVEIAEAVKLANIICIMLPDEVHGPVFQQSICPYLADDDVILTCHGFSLHYGLIEPPSRNSAMMVAPKGAGHRVRSAYTEGHGVPCLVAPGMNANQSTIDLGLAYAKAIGGGRVGVMMTTLAEETETDLFGEQAVLCGGVSALVKAGFETLVEAGYQPEVAYFECVHELKLVVDLIHQGGLAFMRDHISNTAEFGDYTRGPRIVNDATRQVMRTILSEIQQGIFAKEWIEESRAGGNRLKEFRERARATSIEASGKSIIQLLSNKNV